MAVHRKTLTNRTVAALKVSRDTVFWDPDLTGFGVRVYPSGGKVYIAQARGPMDRENPIRVTVGRHDVLHADQARQRAALIITRIKAGEEPVPLPARRPAQLRPDGGQPGRALSRRACRGAAETENAGACPRFAPRPHPAGPRQCPGGGVGANPCRRVPPRTVGPPGHGEQGHQGPVAHVPAGRGLGAWCRKAAIPAGRWRSTPSVRASVS